MPNPLGPIERRVTGVLIEKLLATPAYYPLTLNALTAGCNQKNNRDPEMTLSDMDVQRSLVLLQQAGLAVSFFPEGGRAEKWKTSAPQAWQIASERAMAVIAELLLRGPQTKAELRSRGSRMRHEISAEEIDQILADFTGRADTLAVHIGRAPGGRAERYAHTFYHADELAEMRAAAAAAPPTAATVATVATAEPRKAPAVEGLEEKLDAALREIEALRERVQALEGAVAELRGH